MAIKEMKHIKPIIVTCLSIFIVATYNNQALSIDNSSVDVALASSYGVTYPSKVYVIDDNETINFNEYIKGVVYAEIRGANNIEAYKAQAVTAQNIVMLKAVKLYGWYDEANKIPNVRDDTAQFQAYTKYTPAREDEEPLIKPAVDEVIGMGIFYNDEIIDAEYFAQSNNGFTKNNEDLRGYYFPYLRSQTTPEIYAPNRPTGHMVGMSQRGVISFAESGNNYIDILKHYYNPVPPYVRQVRVEQLFKQIYEGEWILSSDRSKRETLPLTDRQKNIANGNEDLVVTVYFKEKIKIYSTPLENRSVGKIADKPADDLKEFAHDDFIGGTRWKGRFDKATIQNLDGEYPLQINAEHNYNSPWKLDITPDSIARSGAMDNYDSGMDTFHKITIDASGPEIAIKDSLNKTIPPDVAGTMDHFLCVSAEDDGTGLSKIEIYKDDALYYSGMGNCGYLPEPGLYTIKACDKIGGIKLC